MYTETPTAKFLVLAPVQSAPHTVFNNNFLVLSPTESSPSSVSDEQTETESNASSDIRERSGSEASTASSFSDGFLFLGHNRSRGPSSRV